MEYPNGDTIVIGDLIWWNEGSNAGRVALILEEEKDLLSWGVSKPGIFISPGVQGDKLTPAVFCERDDFIGEGIAKIEPDGDVPQIVKTGNSRSG